MNKALPDFVNRKRRKDLIKYTALALLASHIPVGTAYLGQLLGLGQYGYNPVNYIYLTLIVCCLLTLATIQVKAQVTKTFIITMLYIQVLFSLILMTTFFYVMKDLSYLALTSCLLILIFVFIQAHLYISFLMITILTIDFLSVSYVNNALPGLTMAFSEDVLMILVYLPVSSFLAFMCNLVQKQNREIKQSRDKVKTTLFELEETHDELESFNQRMLESLHYAEMIQRSLLPGIDRLKTECPDSLIIWMPKDIVGGDIFFTSTHQGYSIIALMDCTGHGVPGAFLTMLVYSEIRKIILEDACHDPAGILGRLNRSMKAVLNINAVQKSVDDGLDAAVVNINHHDKSIRFAGANIPLFYIENGQLSMIKGDKHSLGYLNSDAQFVFINHTVDASEGMSIYLKTDGLTDQMGGKKGLRFSTNRFKSLILEHHQRPFGEQRNEILQAFFDYKGDNDQRDDITLIALRI